ncbi:MAG: hypothetical protein A2481_02740 [Candidatus Yonathbacteria bacterium RIFOXYC2_FULL_47_9]|nr:MAG: hypothetical protein A2481_02740 [Candidatus Yonathbacteria bacterium RIFOXYC2_FULL_47_9]HAT68318.1 hypothetical protein [Candidatus Yonathbacteria bacterium]
MGAQANQLIRASGAGTPRYPEVFGGIVGASTLSERMHWFRATTHAERAKLVHIGILFVKSSNFVQD